MNKRDENIRRFTSRTQRYLQQLIFWKSQKYSNQSWASVCVADLKKIKNKVKSVGDQKVKSLGLERKLINSHLLYL